MKKMNRKRLLALALSLCMTGVSLPAEAVAEEAPLIGNGGVSDPTETEVAEPQAQTPQTATPSAVTVQTQTVTEWYWTDTESSLDPQSGALMLSATPEFPCMYEDVCGLLPMLNIGTWICESYPTQGAYSGSYVFHAQLPEGCKAAEGLEVPTVTVVFDTPQTMADTPATFDAKGFCSNYEWKDGMPSPKEGVDGCTHTEGTSCYIGCQAAVLTAFDVDGNGKIEDDEQAYAITNPGQLFWFAAQINNGLLPKKTNAYLVEDIHIDDEVPGGFTVWDNKSEEEKKAYKRWMPIGGWTETTGYAGTFDGCGHAIYGICIDVEDDERGLFAWNSGTIRNVTLPENTLISATQSVGGICAGNSGTVTGCSFAGAVRSTRGSTVGGICGNNTGTISSCSSSGYVNASSDYAGGICGKNSGTVTGCRNAAEVTAGGGVGGICGYLTGGSITGCSSEKVKLTATKTQSLGIVGGICGRVDNVNCLIAGCYAGNLLSGFSNSTGGLVGRVYGNDAHVTIRGCWTEGEEYTYSSNSQGIIDCDAVFVNGTAKNPGTTQVTTEELASGKIAWLMQKALTDAGDATQTWYQNIDEGTSKDAYPVLDATHGTVYAADPCPSKFANTQAGAGTVPHAWAASTETGKETKHICSQCGGEASHTPVYTLTESEDGIIGTCADCGASLGSYTLTPPSPGRSELQDKLIYDGKKKEASLDGEMKGVDGAAAPTVTYSYRSSGTGSWTQITDTEALKNAGEYKAEISCGEEAAAVTAGVTYTVAKAMPRIKTSSSSVTINVENSTVVTDTQLNSEVSFTDVNGEPLAGSNALKETQPLTLATNGRTLIFTPTDTMNYRTVEIPVEIYVTDTEAPEVTVSVSGLSGRPWKNIKTDAEVVLFTKEAQTVTISASDLFGLSEIWYGTKDAALGTEPELNGACETVIGTEQSQQVLSRPGIYYIGVWAADNTLSRNKKYVSTDGIVIYADSVLKQTSYTRTYKAGDALTITVENHGNTFEKLKLDDAVLTKDTDYTVTTDTETDVTTITVSAAVLDPLNVSDQSRTWTVVMNPQGAAVNDSDMLSYTASLRVVPRVLTVSGATAGVTTRGYDGSSAVSITDVTFAGLADGESVTYDTQSLQGTLGSADAGTYDKVKLTGLTLTNAANYTLASDTAENVPLTQAVEITKATTTISAQAARNVTYGDGAFSLDVTTDPAGARVAYAVSGDCVTVAADGTVTIKGAGTATVTASVAETTNYTAADQTITISVAQKGYSVTVSDRTYAAAGGSDRVDLGGLYVPKDCGTVNYGTPAVSGGAVAEMKNGVLTYTVPAGTAGDIGSVSVEITTANYQPYTVTIAYTLTENPPVRITSLRAGSVSDTSATVTAAADAAGVTYYLYYTTDPTETVTMNLLKAAGEGHMSASDGSFVLSGLTKSTTYYVYAAAVNDTASANIEMMCFTTLAVPVKPSGGSGSSYGGGGSFGGGSAKPETPDEGKPEEKPEEKQPQIEGENEKAGWDAIREEIRDAENGTKLTVQMNGALTVNGKTMKALSGKDVTVTFDFGKLSLSINGKSLSCIKFKNNGNYSVLYLWTVSNLTRIARVGR